MLRVARVDLHHHVILIDRAVDHRYLTLAEGVVQGVVDLRRGDAKPRGGGAVDYEIRLEPALLLIGADIGEHRTVLELLHQKLRPFL